MWEPERKSFVLRGNVTFLLLLLSPDTQGLADGFTPLGILIPPFIMITFHLPLPRIPYAWIHQEYITPHSTRNTLYLPSSGLPFTSLYQKYLKSHSTRNTLHITLPGTPYTSLHQESLMPYSTRNTLLLKDYLTLPRIFASHFTSSTLFLTAEWILSCSFQEKDFKSSFQSEYPTPLFSSGNTVWQFSLHEQYLCTTRNTSLPI